MYTKYLRTRIKIKGTILSNIHSKSSRCRGMILSLQLAAFVALQLLNGSMIKKVGLVVLVLDPLVVIWWVFSIIPRMEVKHGTLNNNWRIVFYWILMLLMMWAMLHARVPQVLPVALPCTSSLSRSCFSLLVYISTVSYLVSYLSHGR